MMKFSKDHEWVRIDGEIATVGITPYAQEHLGDVVFVELPEAGKHLEKGSAAAVVESVKAASDVYAPISGDIIQTNPEIVSNPALVNSDPTGAGWFFKMTLGDRAELETLMDEATYRSGLD
jgi:glycine cleavage system H protein